MADTEHLASDEASDAWADFLGGVHGTASELPRFRELLESVSNGHLKVQGPADTVTIRAGLQPFRLILKSTGFEPVLMELALIQDLPPNPSSEREESSDTHAFGSFVTCYLAPPKNQELVDSYDAAIQRITKEGEGVAILGHLGAYRRPYRFVEPFDSFNADTTRNLLADTSASDILARKRHFPFSFAKTYAEVHPLNIPRQLVRTLCSSSTLLPSGRYTFILFPFYRPTVGRRVVDPVSGRYLSDYSKSGDGDSPGGILFCLCSIPSAWTAMHIEDKLQSAAWKIQLLIAKALILEAKNELAITRRSDVAVLFHALRGNLKLTQGLGKTLQEIVSEECVKVHGESSPMIAEQFDDLNSQIKRLLEISETCRSVFRGDVTETQIDSQEAVAVISNEIDKNLAGMQNHPIKCSIHSHGDFRMMWCVRHMELVVLEIVRNALKYGDWTDAQDMLECSLSLSSDGLALATIANPISPKVNLDNLRDHVRNRERFLGFTHLNFLTLAVLRQPISADCEYPMFKIEASPKRRFEVTVPIGRRLDQ